MVLGRFFYFFKNFRISIISKLKIPKFQNKTLENLIKRLFCFGTNLWLKLFKGESFFDLQNWKMEIGKKLPLGIFFFSKKILKMFFFLKEKLNLYSFRYVSFLVLFALILSVSFFSNLGAKDVFQNSSENGKSLLVSLIFSEEKNEIIEIALDSKEKKSQADFKKIGGISQEDIGKIEKVENENSIDFSSQEPYFYSFENPIYLPSEKESEFYIVKQGDTISQIAQMYGVSVKTVFWANKLQEENTIKPGDKLEIPPVTGVIHQVKNGETINSIAVKYKVDQVKILAYNDLKETDNLKTDQKLVIPDAEILFPEKKKSIEKKQGQANALKKLNNSLAFSSDSNKQGFVWPTSGRKINQYYKWRHQAIDIEGNYSSPIFASDEGTVVYSGWKTGYGNTVFIRHSNGFETRYGHASELFVTTGQQVSKGQRIATVGSTGWSTGTHLHFEIRKNNGCLNPLSFF